MHKGIPGHSYLKTIYIWSTKGNHSENAPNQTYGATIHIYMMYMHMSKQTNYPVHVYRIGHTPHRNPIVAARSH